jgi:predicted membrane protein
MVAHQVVTLLPVVVAVPRISDLAERHLLIACLLQAVAVAVAVADVNLEPLLAVPEEMVVMV